MTTVSVKKKIKRKFGTLSSFYRASGLTPYDLQRKTTIEINRVVDRTNATLSKPQIPSHKIEMLKLAVNVSGGVVAFCTGNPKFSDRTLFQILQGRRKRMSPVVVELFKHFNI